MTHRKYTDDHIRSAYTTMLEGLNLCEAAQVHTISRSGLYRGLQRLNLVPPKSNKTQTALDQHIAFWDFMVKLCADETIPKYIRDRLALSAKYPQKWGSLTKSQRDSVILKAMETSQPYISRKYVDKL